MLTIKHSYVVSLESIILHMPIVKKYLWISMCYRLKDIEMHSHFSPCISTKTLYFVNKYDPLVTNPKFNPNNHYSYIRPVVFATQSLCMWSLFIVRRSTIYASKLRI